MITNSFVNCTKTMKDDQTSNPKTLEEIEVPADFNWQTYNNMDIKLKGGFNSLVEVASSDGRTVYYKTYLKPGEIHEFQIGVPAFEKQVLIRYMGKELRLDVDEPIRLLEL